MNSEVDDHFDFYCLKCGDELPTTTVTRTRSGGHYSGPQRYTVEAYDLSEDSYFVRTFDEDVIESYFREMAESEFEESMSEVAEDIGSLPPETIEALDDILLEDSREFLERRAASERRNEVESNMDEFSYFIRYLGKEFERYGSSTQPRYVVEGECFDAIRGNSVTGVEEIKKVVENGEEKIIRGRVRLALNHFGELFDHLSRFFEIPVEDENVELEFLHFLEYKNSDI